MDDAAESALITAKLDEARAFPDDFCCDGLDDADEFASQSLAFYRRDFSDLDAYPLIVHVEFHQRGVEWPPVYSVHHDGEVHECSDRSSAIAKYDEVLGSVDRWTSSISSPELAAAPSEPEQPVPE